MGSYGFIDWSDAKNFLIGVSLGGVIISAPEMPSTQVPAKEAVRVGTPHGTVFVTDHQTAGRGRRDRGWSAASGKDLTFSTVIKLGFGLEHAPLLSLASALAVTNVLAEKMPRSPRVSIKWPNDVLVGEKKICGIICEIVRDGSGTPYAVVGIGVNVNRTDAELFDTASVGGTEAASMLLEEGVEFYMPQLLGEILTEFDRTAKMLESDDGRRGLIDEYTRSCGSIGRCLRVLTDDREYFGVATGIASNGALVVDVGNDGIRAFEAADVVHVRFRSE